MRIVLAVTAALLLAACTSTPEPRSAPTTQEPAPVLTTPDVPPGNGPNCANANASVVGKALNLRLQKPSETVDGPVTKCEYLGGGLPTWVSFTKNATAKSFAAAKPEGARDLAGFLDEAYEVSQGQSEISQHTVVARRGAVTIEVHSPAGVDRAKKLVTDLFGRI